MALFVICIVTAVMLGQGLVSVAAAAAILNINSRR